VNVALHKRGSGPVPYSCSSVQHANNRGKHDGGNAKKILIVILCISQKYN
jgi:hypothetical protein